MPKGEIKGRLLSVEGQEYYVIENYDLMDPFLMSVVSNSDHWMYISSTGGLTAGRKNPDCAIFPYYTDDKIIESYSTTGSKTIILATSSGRRFLWKPFSDHYNRVYNVKRNLYKSVEGNRVIFEEINKDLKLAFSYSWMNSESYGWIRRSSLQNISGSRMDISIIDGIRNILPYGVTQGMQTELSTLVDAYKKSELDSETGLGIFRLASIPVDRAVPSEAIKCTTVWHAGFPVDAILLSDRQITEFEKGVAVEKESESKGVSGCYLTVADFLLKPGEAKTMYLAIEIEQDSCDVENLVHLLKTSSNLPGLLMLDVEHGTESLTALVKMADGLEETGERMSCIRHFSNVLFNSMRGGVFENAYEIKRDYFEKHLHRFNKKLTQENKFWLSTLPGCIPLNYLVERTAETGDSDLLRLTYEYLPLSFSRRHGDPSRPWNRFDIRLKDIDGSLLHSYQGNWRDIFQNWESLSLAFPGFLPSIISRFLNSSTTDGYNPYRISSDGIDWEIPDPDNPWSHIGYWGDHQVIYLLRLLEMLNNYKPQQLEAWLDLRIFSYANVPYRIKDYDELVMDPYDTIVFDAEKNLAIRELTERIGADGKMVMDKVGTVIKASFTEKIMVNLLARLVNFIPGAGIWMNTQRPEWNDANNALVGNGASMVTVCYLRRMTIFLRKLYGNSGQESFKIRKEIADLLALTGKILLEAGEMGFSAIDDRKRKVFADQLGRAGAEYRRYAYLGFSGQFSEIGIGKVTGFLDILTEYIDFCISANKRSDGLYNAYNLIDIDDSSIRITPLKEMLEGQVAILSSEILTPEEAAVLIEKLYESTLYRSDQDSFMLQPFRRLKLFRSVNLISGDVVKESRLLTKMVSDGVQSIIREDVNGNYHFAGTFTRAEELSLALDKLNDRYGSLVEEERILILGIYESVFNHREFTGRSGSFYKYEGLGSIYWHMVSKLLLATGEYVLRADDEGCDAVVTKKLVSLYYRIRYGVGTDKSPSDYGAIPTDPYSHTPLMMGVQQPGMTGQVKEDILSRNIELGVRVVDGRISFRPVILRRSEFIIDDDGIEYLSFSVCGTPVRYLLGEKPSAKVYLARHGDKILDDTVLTNELSNSLFERRGEILQIDIDIPGHTLV